MHLLRSLWVALAVGLASGCRIGTSPDTVVRLQLDPYELDAFVGLAIPIRIIAIRADGSRDMVSPRLATFRSSDTAVVQMSPDSAGLVLTKAVGSAEITVRVKVGSTRYTGTIPVRIGFII